MPSHSGNQQPAGGNPSEQTEKGLPTTGRWFLLIQLVVARW
jgi:hypothetical protein